MIKLDYDNRLAFTEYDPVVMIALSHRPPCNKSLEVVTKLVLPTSKLYPTLFVKSYVRETPCLYSRYFIARKNNPNFVTDERAGSIITTSLSPRQIFIYKYSPSFGAWVCSGREYVSNGGAVSRLMYQNEDEVRKDHDIHFR